MFKVLISGYIVFRCSFVECKKYLRERKESIIKNKKVYEILDKYDEEFSFSL